VKAIKIVQHAHVERCRGGASPAQSRWMQANSESEFCVPMARAQTGKASSVSVVTCPVG
jgi:hypothetical protein